jgi:hypothetical protein
MNASNWLMAGFIVRPALAGFLLEGQAQFPLVLAASGRSLHWGQQQQRTAQQQDDEVQREMDVRMVEMGVRGHLSN